MAPNHKVTQHPVHVVFQSHVTNKNHYISSNRVPMATRIGRMVTYFERPLTIKSFYALMTWSSKVIWQTKIIIHPQPECLSLQTWQNDNFTLLSSILNLTLNHSLITWSCKITWQTKTIISLLALCSWRPNLLGWWNTLSGS